MNNELKSFTVSTVLEKVAFAASGKINLSLHLIGRNDEEVRVKFMNSKEFKYLNEIGYRMIESDLSLKEIVIPDSKITWVV